MVPVPDPLCGHVRLVPPPHGRVRAGVQRGVRLSNPVLSLLPLRDAAAAERLGVRVHRAVLAAGTDEDDQVSGRRVQHEHADRAGAGVADNAGENAVVGAKREEIGGGGRERGE